MQFGNDANYVELTHWNVNDEFISRLDRMPVNIFVEVSNPQMILALFSFSLCLWSNHRRFSSWTFIASTNAIFKIDFLYFWDNVNQKLFTSVNLKIDALCLRKYQKITYFHTQHIQGYLNFWAVLMTFMWFSIYSFNKVQVVF